MTEPPSRGQPGRRWALVVDAVWDGARRHRDHAVLIDGDLVTGLVPWSEVPQGMARTRVEGMAVPGLIDCHVHLADWMLPGLLAAGVTTVRDTGNDLAWILERRRRTAADPTTGPRIVCSGPLVDGPTAHWPAIGRAHADTAAIGASVDELAVAGVDLVKLYVNVDAHQARAAVVAARDRGLAVIAHLGVMSLDEAIAAGVSEVQHLSGCVHHVDGPVEDLDVLVGALRSSGTVLCPTLVVWDRLARVNDAVFTHDARRRWVHPAILAAWARFPHRTSPLDERMDRQASVVAMKSAVATLRSSGVRIIAGSDSPWPGIVPGFGLHDELSLLVDAGLSPAEALGSATALAADALGLGGVVGRLAPGQVADVLVVGGDPLADITDLGDTRMVVRAGVVVGMDDLEDRLAGAAGRPADDPVSMLIAGVAGTGPG